MAEVFTNDPINWLKWVVVFAVLVGSFIISMKIIRKMSYALQGQKKTDAAKKKGYVIPDARLVESRKKYEGMEKRYKAGQHYYGTYEYELDGKVYRYHTYFKHKIPPKTLTLYYKNNPQKPFCMEEYTWNPSGGILYLFFILMPFLLAALTAIVLGIPLYDSTEAVNKIFIDKIWI